MALASEPAAAPFRSAFEAQFPRSEATGAALELERIAAGLGIDLAPRSRRNASSAAAEQRQRPSPEERSAYRSVASAVSEFVERELKDPEEKIGKLPEALERFLSEHEGPMAAIESLLLREPDLQWETDVSRAHRAPLPNLPGLMSLHRLLVARALLEARGGETERALQTLEASWRLNEVLTRRPEFICHFLVVAGARLEAGALRKLDSPAYGWGDRLRSRSFLSGFLAAFQNEAWYSGSAAEDLTGKAGAYGRTLRQIAEDLERIDLCDWSPEKLQEAWTRAHRDQYPDSDYEPAAPNQKEAFLRWPRYHVEAELTALVLDARAERAAARPNAWPPKLATLGRGVCGISGWSYRPSARGTAMFAFEGRLVEGESAGLRLPLAFTAGVPVTPTPRSTRRPTPRPTLR